MRIVAIVMIVAGLIVAFLGWQGITTREDVVDFGPVDIVREETRRSNVPVIGGVVMAVVGLGMLLATTSRHRAAV